jgi:hypothetical protein
MTNVQRACPAFSGRGPHQEPDTEWEVMVIERKTLECLRLA